MAGVPISCLRRRGLFPPGLGLEVARSVVEDIAKEQCCVSNTICAPNTCFQAAGPRQKLGVEEERKQIWGSAQSNGTPITEQIDCTVAPSSTVLAPEGQSKHFRTTPSTKANLCRLIIISVICKCTRFARRVNCFYKVKSVNKMTKFKEVDHTITLILYTKWLACYPRNHERTSVSGSNGLHQTGAPSFAVGG